MAKAGKKVLFDPEGVPFKGLATSQDKYALGPGWFKQAKNNRVTNGVLSRRAGMTNLLDVPAANGSFKGAYLHENYDPSSATSYSYLYLALAVSGKTRIYFSQSTNGGSFGGWTEMTAASGMFGETRRTNPDSYGYFSVVNEGNGYAPKLVFQSGRDEPLVGTLTASGTMAKVKAVANPTWAESVAPVFSNSSALAMTSGTGSTTSTRSASNSFNDPASRTNHWDITTVDTGTAGTSTTVYQNSGTVDFTKGSQVWVVCSFTDESFFSNCKWELRRSGGSFVTVNDPSTAAAYDIVQTDVSGVYVVVFDLDQATAPSDVNGLRITVNTSGGMTNGAVLKVWGLQASGYVPGFAAYAVAYQCSYSRAESAGVVMKTGQTDNSVTYIVANGGTVTPVASQPRDPAGVSGVVVRGDFTAVNSTVYKMPMSAVMRYKVNVPVKSPTSTEVANGVDTCNIYRKDPQLDRYYLVGSQPVAQYTLGAWTYQSPWTGYDQKQWVADTSTSDALDQAFWAPDEYNEVLPQGTAMCPTHSRLYVCSVNAGSISGSSVMASEQDKPFRFRREVRYVAGQTDLSSGFETRLETGDDAVALCPLANSTQNGGTLLAFTRNSVVSINGFRATPIPGSKGTFSPFSVCAHRGAVFYVDSERVQTRIGVKPRQMSREYVQDQFEALSQSNAKTVWSAVSRDRLYTVLPGSSNKTLVYYDVHQMYESVDTYNASAPNPVAFLAWHQGGDNALLAITATGKVYAYEKGSTDDSYGIDSAYTFPSLRVLDGMKTTVNSLELVCTDQSGGTVSATKADIKTGTAQTSTFTLPGTATYAWLTDVPQKKAVSAHSVDVTVSSTGSYPFDFLSVLVDVMYDQGWGPTGVTG